MMLLSADFIGTIYFDNCNHKHFNSASAPSKTGTLLT